MRSPDVRGSCENHRTCGGTVRAYYYHSCRCEGFIWKIRKNECILRFTVKLGQIEGVSLMTRRQIRTVTVTPVPMPDEMARQKKAEETASFRLFKSDIKKIRQLAIREGTDPADYFAKTFRKLLTAKHKQMSERQVKEDTEE